MMLLRSLNRVRRPVLVGIAILCTGATLAACAVSVTGGILSSLVTAVVWLALFVGTATTQPGCGPCLSMVHPEDLYVPPDVPDAGPADTHVGPCLGAPLDPDVGPCLSAVPDVGPCLSDPGPQPDPDVGPCLGRPLDPDIDVGPCLEDVPPTLDEGPLPADVPPAEARSRAAVRERLIASGALPADVAARLAKKS